MNLRFSQALRFNAKLRGDKVAFRLGKAVLTFREVETRSARLAAFLLSEYSKGDRICVVLSNSLIHAELYFGCARAGVLIVPINPGQTAAEITRVLDECAPSLLITELAQSSTINEALNSHGRSIRVLYNDLANNSAADDGEIAATQAGWEGYEVTLSHIEPLGGEDTTSADDACIILFTSGTTGRPKGVLHSQSNFMSGALLMIVSLGIVEPGRALQLLPMSGINLLWVLVYYLAGLETNIISRFDADALLVTLDEEKITHTVIAPIMLDLLTRCNEAGRPHDFSSLQMMGYGGSRTPPRVQKRALQIFGPVLRQMYGQTEATGLLATKDKSLHLSDHDSVGYPLLGSEIRIIGPDRKDVTDSGVLGEIQARVGFARVGYWRNDDIQRAPEGWLETGDTGLVDNRGRLVVVGRTDDMIVTGGNNVFPREVEEVLLQSQHVVDVSVLGLPDDVWGETVAAFIVTSTELSTDALKDEISNHCKGLLTSAKRPRSIYLVDALPRNSTGKVRKPALIEIAKTKEAG